MNFFFFFLVVILRTGATRRRVVAVIVVEAFGLQFSFNLVTIRRRSKKRTNTITNLSEFIRVVARIDNSLKNEVTIVVDDDNGEVTVVANEFINDGSTSTARGSFSTDLDDLFHDVGGELVAGESNPAAFEGLFESITNMFVGAKSLSDGLENVVTVGIGSEGGEVGSKNVHELFALIGLREFEDSHDGDAALLSGGEGDGAGGDVINDGLEVREGGVGFEHSLENTARVLRSRAHVENHVARKDFCELLDLLRGETFNEGTSNMATVHIRDELAPTLREFFEENFVVFRLLKTDHGNNDVTTASIAGVGNEGTTHGVELFSSGLE